LCHSLVLYIFTQQVIYPLVKMNDAFCSLFIIIKIS